MNKGFLKSKREIIQQVAFFGIVGLITLLIDVAVTKTLHVLLDLPAALASGIGFLSAFLFNFPMNRKQVFRHSNKDRFSLKTQIIMYAGLSLFNLLATSLLVGWLTDSGILEIQYAKIIITAIFAAWNFIIFKKIIFSKNHKTNSL